MQADRGNYSRAAILLAGFAAGALTRALTNTRNTREIAALKRSIADMQARLTEQRTELRQSVERIETRLEEHETKLADVPSTGQIVDAMEQLLSKTMLSLNQRMAAQADAIELMKTTVAQTDGLLERVLEALDLLRQSPAEPGESGGE